jgi:hypothetical protein
LSSIKITFVAVDGAAVLTKSIHFSEMSLSPFQTPFAHKAIKSGQDPGIGIYLLKNKIAKSVGASKSISHSNFVKQSFPWEFNIGFVIPRERSSSSPTQLTRCHNSHSPNRFPVSD